MDLKQLTYIVTIAQEQNLSRAAEKLYVSQSTLSLYLKKLEQELGIPLFTRRNNRLSITPAGKLYMQTAQELLEMKEALYKTLRARRTQQTLNIGIASQLLLQIFAQVLIAFKPTAPNFTVNITEGRSVDLIARLEAGEIDTAIVGRSAILENDRCNIRLLWKEEFCLVLPPSHPHRDVDSADYDNPPAADMGLFSNSNFALCPHDTCDYQIASAILLDHNMNGTVFCELNNTVSICNMVREGLCLSIMPSYCVPRDMGLLVCRPRTSYYRYALLIRQKDRTAAPEEEALLDMLIHAYKHWHDSRPAARISFEP